MSEAHFCYILSFYIYINVHNLKKYDFLFLVIFYLIQFCVFFIFTILNPPNESISHYCAFITRVTLNIFITEIIHDYTTNMFFTLSVLETTIIPTFLWLVPLSFALVLKAHGALVHLVGLNTELAAEALGIICRQPEQRRARKETKLRQEEVEQLTHCRRAFYY